MSDLEAKISTVIECFKKLKDVDFDGERYVAPNRYKQIVEEHGILTEEYGDTVRIKLKAFFEPFNLKYSPNLISEVKPDEVSSDFLVFDSSPSFIFYGAADFKYESFGVKNLSLLEQVKNLVLYLTMFNYLRSSEFCDYYNAPNNEIIIYNSSNGIQRIKFETIPDIKSLGSIEKNVQSILEFAKPLQFKLFFQNAAFSVAGKTGIISIYEMINKYAEIIALTQRDYQLVNKKFNFETFQDSLVKEKNKYFSSIRDVLGKVASQSIGIPISIGATVFTSYKVSSDLPLIVLILFTFLIYVLFYVKIQKLYRRDVAEIKRDFVRDFEMIREKSGLETTLIDAERRAIEDRILKIDSIILWLIIMVVVLGVIVTVFLIYQMLPLNSTDIESAIPKLI